MKHGSRARKRAAAARSAAFAGRARRAAAFLLALASLGTSGCALFPRRPPAPPRPAPGYEHLRDTLARVDASGIAGRRIALDPGHGGFFRGALGVHGLTEAEANLGVALRLRDLLATHGALVFLTRETNRDFLTSADSSLRADLAERARLAGSFAPDLFLSIHHNADARGAHDVNETQTYYKVGDEGPSLDAAQDVHRSLVRNVGIATNQVLPGNFYVLRVSDAPAILTETSYITYPGVEKRLRLPEKQALEAEALFIGLAHYFARRVPVIEEMVADWSTGSRWMGGPDWAPGPVLRARIHGSFDEASLEVDGVPRVPERSGASLWWRPEEPLDNGDHEAVLRVRLAGAGAARAHRLRFSIDRPVCTIEATPWPDVLDPEGGLAGIRVRPLDLHGRPVRDSVRVRMRAVCACDAPRDTVVTVIGGEGWLYARIAPRYEHPHPDLEHQVASADFWGEQLRDEPLLLVSGPPRLSVQLEFRIQDWDRRPRTVGTFLRRMPGDSALTNPPGLAARGDAHPWVNRDGFAVFELDSTGRVRVPALPGYRVWPDSASEAGALPVRWTPLCGGALHGKRIVLDPEGGGDDAAGQGPGGTRAAFLNLESARILAGFLTAAGAELRLTRDGDQALSDVERVERSEAFHADRFVRIAHRTSPPRLGHYFASAAGRAWAQRAAREFAALGLPVPAAGEEAQYVLQQTSSPALLASPSTLGSEADEARILAPGALRAEAYALFLALAREWAPDAAWPLDSLTVLDAAGRPVPGAAVTLGGALVLITGASGRVGFARTEPGPILVEVEDPRARARGVLLESQRGAVLTGSPGR
jgi:N-acetylmuramoyl-L-alanine amidase